jgi:hypothetical protein
MRFPPVLFSDRRRIVTGSGILIRIGDEVVRLCPASTCYFTSGTWISVAKLFDFFNEQPDPGGGGLGLQAQDAHLQGPPHTVVPLRASRQRPGCRAAEPSHEFAP